MALAAVMISGCRGGASQAPPGVGPGTVTTLLSDPAPCSDRFEHVWITVSGVRVNQSTAAEDAGFVELTPDLATHPRQIDLLGPVTVCYPATLESVTLELIKVKSAATYQQIRLTMLNNGAPGANVTPPPENPCSAAGGDVFNCVQDKAGAFHALALAPEANGGIRIPVAQIACGGVMVVPEQNREIEIAFNACASVVQDGANFVLKPVAWGRSRRVPPPD